MTPNIEDITTVALSQTEFQELLHQKLCHAIRFALINILEAEVEAFLGARPYQRTGRGRDYRNGIYQRSLSTSVGHIPDVVVPRTRGGFRTRLFRAVSTPPG